MPWRATQDVWVMVESSDKTWSTGEGNGKPLQYSCLENPMNSMKRQKERIQNDELPRSVGAQHAMGDQWTNNSRKNKEKKPKQKQHPVVDVTGDGSKAQCCNEQYCTGTWNVKSINQGKLKVVKQEMTRLNTDILGIDEPKWTWMDEFNSDGHYTYYCGQESLGRNGVALIVNKSPKCSPWVQSQKWQNDLCSFPRQIIQHHNCFYSVATGKHGLGIQNEAGQRLIEFCQENALIIIYYRGTKLATSKCLSGTLIILSWKQSRLRRGTCLVEHWLRLCASNSEGLGLIPD